MSSPSARAAELLPNPFSPDEPDDKAGYQKTIREGVAEYQAGRFEEALSLFRRAHQLSPSARTFRGIGMASFEVRDYVTAVRTLSAALQDKRKSLSPEQRKDAQALLERSQAFVDAYQVKLVPRTARILVDGRAPDLEPDGTLLLGFGIHVVEASAPGMTKLSRSIDVRGGARKELVFLLESLPSAGAPVPRPGPGVTVAAVSPRTESPRSWGGPWLWGSIGAAVVASGAGVYWYKQSSELNTCRNPTAGLRCTTEDTLATQRNAAMAVTLGAGGVAVTMALIAILTSKPAPAGGQQQASLTCSPSPTGITCGGLF